MSRMPQSELKARLAYRKEHGSEEGFVPPPRKKRDNEEWRIQSAFFDWWRSAAGGLGVWPGLFYHVPNGSMLGDDSKSRAIRAKMLAKAGVVNGVVDCFLAVPTGVCSGGSLTPGPLFSYRYPGLYIEFKKPSQRFVKNGGLSNAQKEFIDHALFHGYCCHVCYSWEEARNVVLNYLKK